AGRLRRGDVLVVPSLDRAFATVADAASMLWLWGGSGVVLHAVDLGGAVADLGAGAMAEAMAKMGRAIRSERAAAAAARSRDAGRPVSGSAPCGHVWARRPGDGGWELVRDDRERELMGKLLEWHEAGHTIDAIRQHLTYGLKLRFFKRRGKQERLVHWTNS